MLFLMRGGGRFPLMALALGLGIWGCSDSSAVADVHGSEGHYDGRFRHWNLSSGPLGWAPPGMYPGLNGFSLRWHKGYGYGRYALGVGANGGYPFYGGPGYPHEPPPLRRFGPARPIAYYGGAGFPGCGYNFYQGVGPLVVNKPVVSIGEPDDFGYVGENGETGPGRDFGGFTGAYPYPETYFAPYTSAAATTGSASGSPSAEGPARPLMPGVAPMNTERPSFLPPVGSGPPPASR